MPDAGRNVGTHVGVELRLLHDIAAEVVVVPRAIWALRLHEPLVGATCFVVHAHHIERHRRLDVVPRVAVSAGEPRNHAVAELQRGDPFRGGAQFVGGGDASTALHGACSRRTDRNTRGGIFVRVDDERLSDCWAEQVVERAGDERRTHDVPLEQFLVGLHERVVFARRADCAAQPPIRRMQSVRPVRVADSQTDGCDFVAQFVCLVDAHVPAGHEGSVVLLAQHPVNFFRKPRWYGRGEHSARFQHACEFAQSCFIVVDVLEHFARDDAVERTIGEGETRGVTAYCATETSRVNFSGHCHRSKRVAGGRDFVVPVVERDHGRTSTCSLVGMTPETCASIEEQGARCDVQLVEANRQHRRPISMSSRCGGGVSPRCAASPALRGIGRP